jgi:hypothetical protein
MEKPEEIKVEEEKLLEQDVMSVPNEIPEEEVTKSEPEAEENKTEAIEEHPAVPEAKPEGEELEQESKEEGSSPVDDNDNKNDETKDKTDETGIVGEEKATDPNETTELDKETEEGEEDRFEEEKVSPEQAELVAQLEELRAEKEDREALEACNKEVMKVEEEFNQCTNKIAEALRTSFAQNDIDPTKSLEELRKENPAKATLAEQFIRQATELKANLEKAAMEEVAKHQNEVIYRAASREFVKMGLNLEQAKNAVATFKRIVNEIGVTDLGDDLKMKVQLAAGRAKIVVPEGMVVPEVKPAKAEGVTDDDTTDLKEPSPEKEKVEPAEEPEKEKDVPPIPVVEKSSEPVVQKPKVEDFEEGVTGKTSVNAGTMINELNVLDELVKLPYRERARFYKEHEDVIAKALSKRG